MRYGLDGENETLIPIHKSDAPILFVAGKDDQFMPCVENVSSGNLRSLASDPDEFNY